MRAPELSLALLLLVGPAAAGSEPAPPLQDLRELRPGYWVEVKGTFGSGDVFRASAIEVLPVGEQESLIGVVEKVDTRRERFWVLGQEVHTSEKTSFDGLDLRHLVGQRIKVEGYWRGPGNFAAREVSPRGAGRDRLTGRLDVIERVSGALRLRVMSWTVILPLDAKVENEEPFTGFELSPPRIESVESLDQRREVNDERYIPGSIWLTKDLTLGALLRYRYEHKEDFDLDPARERDRDEHLVALTAQVAWAPSEDFIALGRLRLEYVEEMREGEPDVSDSKLGFSELWFDWRRIFGSALELRVGRQDFDEQREWLYDENLDAVRLAWSSTNFRAELSASTVFNDGTERDENTDNFILYLSNNDSRRHLGAYVIDRRDQRDPADYPIFLGVRALGDWVPQNQIWSELSFARGYTGNTDLDGWGFDVGTTWFPSFLGPAYLTLGYAWGSGDADVTDGDDGNFRQTGLQDNNDRFGGVTSFHYYGELVDPELSNLAIWTAGVGTRLGTHGLARRTSIDLVFHKLNQVEAVDFLRDTNLRRRPDGLSDDLGWEIDLVFGTRFAGGWDVEIIGASFHPGDAFPGSTDAWFAGAQVRYRF